MLHGLQRSGRGGDSVKKSFPKKNKKGATLAEVAVALAVFGIVVAAATSITLSSVQARNNAFLESRAQEIVYNTVECFRFAETKEEFLGALNEAYGFEVEAEDLGLNEYQFNYEQIAVTIGVEYNIDTQLLSAMTVTATYGDGKSCENSFKRA